jgi:hypothetical protein
VAEATTYKNSRVHRRVTARLSRALTKNVVHAQMLKNGQSARFCRSFVVAEATTYKDSMVPTQRLKVRSDLAEVTARLSHALTEASCLRRR